MSDGTPFWKMSGAGNDFVVVGPEVARELAGREARWARSVCRRGPSVGADGVVLVEPLGSDGVRVRYHNPDGSAAFCANGTRCAARYARLQGLAGDAMRLETAAGEVEARVGGDHVWLTLPPPGEYESLQIDVGGETLAGTRVLAGVPHFVVIVDEPAAAPLERWGPLVRHHPRFGPAGTNLDVCAIAPGGAVRLRTWERGVERETLACGSGAVAAAWVARRLGAGAALRIVPPSGVPLDVELCGPAEAPTAARLGGEARVVFRGRLAGEPQDAG